MLSRTGRSPIRAMVLVWSLGGVWPDPSAVLAQQTQLQIPRPPQTMTDPSSLQRQLPTLPSYQTSTPPATQYFNTQDPGPLNQAGQQQQGTTAYQGLQHTESSVQQQARQNRTYLQAPLQTGQHVAQQLSQQDPSSPGSCRAVQTCAAYRTVETESTCQTPGSGQASCEVTSTPALNPEACLTGTATDPLTTETAGGTCAPYLQLGQQGQATLSATSCLDGGDRVLYCTTPNLVNLNPPMNQDVGSASRLNLNGNTYASHYLSDNYTTLYADEGFFWFQVTWGVTWWTSDYSACYPNEGAWDHLTISFRWRVVGYDYDTATNTLNALTVSANVMGHYGSWVCGPWGDVGWQVSPCANPAGEGVSRDGTVGPVALIPGGPSVDLFPNVSCPGGCSCSGAMKLTLSLGQPASGGSAWTVPLTITIPFAGAFDGLYPGPYAGGTTYDPDPNHWPWASFAGYAGGSFYGVNASPWQQSHTFVFHLTAPYPSFTVSPQTGCWDAQDTWVYNVQGTDSCAAYRQQGCGSAGGICLATDSAGDCLAYQNTYRCATTQCAQWQTTEICAQCTDPASGVPCAPPPQAGNPFLINAAAYGQALKDARGHWDPTTLTVFTGQSDWCTYGTGVGGLVLPDCCAQPPDSSCSLCQNVPVPSSPSLYNQAAAQCRGSLPPTYRSDASAGRANEHYIGDMCVQTMTILGFSLCVQKAQVYCGFPSVLAKEVQEQGRAQIQKGWGTPENPECSGFTIEQFRLLKIDRMDLSGAFPNLTVTYDPTGMQQSGVQNVQQYNGQQQPVPLPPEPTP